MSLHGDRTGTETDVKRSVERHKPDTEHGQGQPPKDTRTQESEIDQALADSFPASDPPPWTLGVERVRGTKIIRK